MVEAHPDYVKQLISELQDRCDLNKSCDNLSEKKVSMALLQVWFDRKVNADG